MAKLNRTEQGVQGIQGGSKLILPDTTLCAIVRDEMMNPAQLPGKSGIRSFVESHVPYVEQAVIVDTGSVDGTRQELEQLQAEFPNLKVRDHKFKGYVTARNYSMSQVGTRNILVLDVDEVLPIKEAKSIAQRLKRRGLKFPRKVAIDFDITTVHPSGYESHGEGHDKRLFLNSPNVFFSASAENGNGELWEYLYLREGKEEIFVGETRSISGVHPSIYHFRSGIDGGYTLKRREWYFGKGFEEKVAPSSMPHFKTWKQPNSARPKYS